MRSAQVAAPATRSQCIIAGIIWQNATFTGGVRNENANRAIISSPESPQPKQEQPKNPKIIDKKLETGGTVC